MPLAMCDTPAAFQRMINDIMRDFSHNFLIVSLDDVCHLGPCQGHQQTPLRRRALPATTTSLNDTNHTHGMVPTSQPQNTISNACAGPWSTPSPTATPPPPTTLAPHFLSSLNRSTHHNATPNTLTPRTPATPRLDNLRLHTGL
jgi:hypothetical protein